MLTSNSLPNYILRKLSENYHITGHLTLKVQQRLAAIGYNPEKTSLFRFVTSTPAGSRMGILGSSLKVVKGLKKGVLTSVVYLSPADESGCNLCPWAGDCAAICLGHSSGHLAMPANKITRIKKSLFLVLYKSEFMRQLSLEISLHAEKARRMGKRAAIRLNGSSDVRWERETMDDGRSLMSTHPDVEFYDYTKAPQNARSNLPVNYHLTFSLQGGSKSWNNAKAWLDAGRTVAIVVGDTDATLAGAKQVSAAILRRKSLFGYPVSDGDATDIRMDDAPGSWVVLHAKGSAVKDRSGFVRRFSVAELS